MNFAQPTVIKEVLGEVVSVNLSAGGIPKHPQPLVTVIERGIVGDQQAHEKHRRPDRALSLWDEELLQELVREGYEIVPGSIGENILLRGVDVQNMDPGTMLEVGSVLIKLEQPRKPCFILDPIDVKLKDVIAGRTGYMASVIKGGEIRPGDVVRLIQFNPPTTDRGSE